MNPLTEAVAKLRLGYPRQDFPDESVAFYVAMLGDLDHQAVSRAVTRVCRRSTWLPSIAEIRLEVAEEQLQLPSVEDAWIIASRGQLKGAAPEVRAAADAVGGRGSIIRSERPEQMSRWFRDEYRARRERSIREFAGANAVPDMGQLPGPTMAALPETRQIKPRPIVMRWMLLMSNGELPPATDEEKADAIAYMRDNYPEVPSEDPVYCVAEKILAEASV